MKITATIADIRKPEGWPECYTAPKWDTSTEEARSFIQFIVDEFNRTMKAYEWPRRLVSVSVEEIDEADAFNMGMNAYNQGKERDADNYWPEGHANHQHWRDGWEEGRAIDEDGDDEEEGEDDE